MRKATGAKAIAEGTMAGNTIRHTEAARLTEIATPLTNLVGPLAELRFPIASPMPARTRRETPPIVRPRRIGKVQDAAVLREPG